MSIRELQETSIAERVINPSVTELLAAYPTKSAFDAAVQQGKIKPTTEAGVASEIINTYINDALAKQAQQTATVFQDNTGQQQMPQMGVAAAQQAAGQPMPQGQGVNQVPIPPQMFDRQGMAAGGIVAFQAGGASSVTRAPSLAELYNDDFALRQRLLGPNLAAIAEKRRLEKEVADEAKAAERRKWEAGLDIGSRLMGTKEEDYFTALGQAIQPGAETYAKKEEAARNVQAARQKELARIEGLDREEAAKAFESASARRTVLEGQQFKAQEAERDRQLKKDEAALDRKLKTNLVGLSNTSAEKIAKMNIESKEFIANLPPDVVKGAFAIQRPGEDINDALGRFTELSTKAPDRYNAGQNAQTAALKAANEEYQALIGISGPLRDLYAASVSPKDSKEFKAAQKKYGIRDPKDAEKILNDKKESIREDKLKDLPFTKEELKGEYRRGSKNTEGSKPPPKPKTISGSPEGSSVGNYVPGKGWEIKDASGKLIGYGQP